MTVDIIHEQRFGMKNQIEIDVPLNFQDQNHTWYGGVGDATLAVKREIFSSLRSGSILSLQGGVLVPTGSRTRGFGSGTTTFETFAAFDQLFPTNTFLQTQLGADLPRHTDIAPAIALLADRRRPELRCKSRSWPALVTDGRIPGRSRSHYRSENQLGHSSRDAGNDQPKTARPRQPRSAHTNDKHDRTASSGHVLHSLGLGRRKADQRLVMQKHIWCAIAISGIVIASAPFVRGGARQRVLKPEFHTSDRCVACHNGLTTKSGEDISIGLDWRPSMMANSSRDPYWQASVRRESVDHPESKAAIEDECSVCHMPIIHLQAKREGRKAEIFSHLPFNADNKDNAAAEDGVTCSVCHQIAKEKLGTPESFNGGFKVDDPEKSDQRPEYGPFDVNAGHERVMQSSTGGFRAHRGRSHSRFCAVRNLPHSVHPGSGAGRKRDRRISRADAIP